MIGTIRYKIILMGDPGVGKTTLRKRFMGKEVVDRYETTIGVEVSEKTIDLGNIVVKMLIFDVAGQKQFEYLHDLFFMGSNGSLMVFDVTRPKSFERSLLWIRRYWSIVGQKPVVLIGNKIDLLDKRRVEGKDIAAVAKKLSEKCKCEIPYYETSALKGINVDIAFKTLITQIIKHEGKIEIDLNNLIGD